MSICFFTSSLALDEVSVKELQRMRLPITMYSGMAVYGPAKSSTLFWTAPRIVGVGCELRIECIGEEIRV